MLLTYGMRSTVCELSMLCYSNLKEMRKIYGVYLSMEQVQSHGKTAENP